jgi:hypothetical protein
MAETTEKAPSAYDRLRHLDECPEARLESFVAERPSGDRVGIVRCIDCGESAVVSEEAVLEEREAMRKASSSSKKA